ncbi:MAG: S8 family serine peptidase [Burkholderiales bacterium]|nr:S8 family serine peptidase [Nitrosomonas sp.]MCP5273607.1 S8 family serine peptidase [Burkholderiales bacterium]
MEKNKFKLVIGAAVLFSCSQTVAVSAGLSRVWVEFQPAGSEHAQAVLNQVGAKIHYRFDDLNTFAVSVPQSALQGLERNPHVTFIEEDPKRYPSAQQVPYGIDMVQARDVWDADRDSIPDSNSPTGSGRMICLIDSGIQRNHEDFAGVNIVGGYPAGWDNDTCGHGTHVAGTMLAANNNIGVVGVSPGALSLYAVKVFDGESCGWSYSSDLVDAAKRCQAAGASVINMSLGGSLRSRTEDRAFKQLYENSNILSVAAAGNDGNTRYSYPASYGSVISVAAVDSNKVIAEFSQQNSAVELAAPGVGVNSTVPWLSDNSVTVGSITYQGNHMANSGYTSDGSPLVKRLIDGGLCEMADVDPATWKGSIVICERGGISFFDKGLNVFDAGGSGAVIYNNTKGNFAGTLGDGNSLTIPMITLSQSDGQNLLAYITANPLEQGSLVGVFDSDGSGYEAWNGTSMATPHVSAVAGLVWSADTSKTNAEIRNALIASAEDLGDPGKDNAYGYGLVQALVAWHILGGGSGSDNNQAPVASFTYDCPDLDCTFNAATSVDPDGTIENYSWNFGDSAVSSGLVANHTYQSAGIYEVTLTVTDDKGEIGVDSKTVSAIDPSDVSPPIISNVQSGKTKGNKFRITWTTDEPASSGVILACCGEYSNDALAMQHSMEFMGSKGETYNFTVRSSDAAGNTSLDGPYVHQN